MEGAFPNQLKKKLWERILKQHDSTRLNPFSNLPMQGLLAFQPIHVLHGTQPEFNRDPGFPPPVVFDFTKERELLGRPFGQKDRI